MGPDDYDEGAAQRQKRMRLNAPMPVELPPQPTLADLLQPQQQQIDPGYLDKLKSLLMRRPDFNMNTQPTATYGIRG